MIPKFQELPNGDAKGVFGADDVLGSLNRQTPEAIVAAAQQVRSGAMFSLNGPLDWPDPPLFAREPIRHTVYRTPMGNLDDYVDSFYPQSSSQWDGFLHIADPEIGRYNHLADERLGIESWASRGIAGRAVLLDVERWCTERGERLEWNAHRPITANELDEVRVWAGVEPLPGDILLVRTGWVAGYQSASPEARVAAKSRMDSPGLGADEEIAEYLWDWGVSAVASDNIAVEAIPLAPHTLHRRVLVRLGIPLGELWWLDELAAHSAQDGRWTSLLVSAPWHLAGSSGSPANAIALK